MISDWTGNTLEDLFAKSVCVEECPKTAKLDITCHPTSKVAECPTDGDWKVDSYSIMKICIPLTPPDAVQQKIDMIKSMITDSAAGAHIEDMRRASRAINTSIALSVVYSIVFIYFLSIFGETLAWICVVIIELLFIGATAAAYFNWTY
jgi:hypothetical protein